MKLDARMTMFMTLVATFMVCLVVGDLIGGKLVSFEIFGWKGLISAGQIAFPVTFILTDILNEFYGKRVVRRITVLAFFMVGLTLCIIKLADLLPIWEGTTASDWKGFNQESWHRVFTQAMQIQIASMFAFITSNFVDISAFFIIKKLTGNRFLWLRSTGSTAISQIIDTLVINAILWVWNANFTISQYISICISSYGIKLVAAVAITPLLYALHALIEKRFGIAPAEGEAEE